MKTFSTSRVVRDPEPRMRAGGEYGLAVAALIFAASCRGPSTETTPPAVKAPIAVEARTLQPREIARTLQEASTVRGIQEVTVISQTSGVIERSFLRLGKSVRQGDTLVTVESVIQHAALEQARRALETAELSLNVTEKLHERNNASTAELKAARSQVAGAKAGYTQALKAYENATIIAPINGFIAQREMSAEKGNVLNPGIPVCRIVNISRLSVTVPVGEPELGFLRNGMKARISVASLENATFTGEIAGIGAGSTASTGSYPVEIEFTNTRDYAVKSGMAVTVTIESSSRKKTLLVPLAVVVERDKRQAVYVSVGNKAKLSFVTTGRVAGDEIEVTGGITEGDLLVLTGVNNLASGDSLLVTMVN